MYPLPHTPAPFSNLLAVLWALRGGVAAWGGRGWLSAALTWLLCSRISDVCRRMDRLVERYRAGRLVVRRGGCVRGVAAPVRGPRAARIWPGRFGWLVRAASYHAAGYGSQLRAALETPDMVALIAAAPQAARILLPICRALGIETRVLRPVVVVVPVVVPVPEGRLMGGAALTHPTAKLKLEPFRIPLPRGVISAARRAGFRKVT